MQKLAFHRFYIIINFACLLCYVQFIQCHRTDVYIAGFFPYGAGKENSETGMFFSFSRKIALWFEYFINCLIILVNIIHLKGRGVMPSVKLALDHVNEHSDILANYRLHMWWNDTQVRKSIEPYFYTAKLTN